MSKQAKQAKQAKAKPIPFDLWEDIYRLYASGFNVSKIHKYATNIWKLDVSIHAIYTLIRQMRIVKAEKLKKLLDEDNVKEMDRVLWLQDELEEMATEQRFNDPAMFLKIADRLIKIYELKLGLYQRRDNSLPADNGREALLKELAGYLNKETTEKHSLDLEAN